MDRFNLGAYGRPISTRSAETQRWFDIGLNWCYGFNHEEGIKCFKKALESDPGCAMVHWGIAYAAGPFYNLTWKEHGDAEADSATRRCFEHVQLARANAADASPVERRLMGATHSHGMIREWCQDRRRSRSLAASAAARPR
jgi:hypothetical protein